MVRKILVAAIGLLQIGIGISLIIFIYFFYNNLFDFQIIFNIPSEYSSFYVLLLVGVGIFSLISGLTFIQEWRGST